MANTATITLDQVFRFYKGLPHQRAAILLLEADLKANGYSIAMRRDREWFHVWSQSGKQVENAWVPIARDLIYTFEGCELEAYPDPGSGGDPWTIGYGHTGPEVVPGYKISQEKAVELFESDSRQAAEELFSQIPLSKDWLPNEIAALVSFIFNFGGNNLASSTLKRRLLAKEDKHMVIQEELPKWVNVYVGNKKLKKEGLVRRRNAEVALFRYGNFDEFR